MKEIIEEILKIIFVVVLATFLFWTGEIFISAITIGRHRPKWNGYKEKTPFRRVICEVSIGLTGFIFWLAAIPSAIQVFEKFNSV